MAVFSIYIVRTDQTREVHPETYSAARPAFEAAFQLADRLAGEAGRRHPAPRFVDVYEGERLCIGIGVGGSEANR